MKIKELYKIKKGKKAPAESESQLPGYERYIQIKDLRDDENVTYCEPHRLGTPVTKDDLVIAWDGANAGTVGFGLEGQIGSTLARLRPKSYNVLPSYSGRFLQTQFDYFQRTATGATIPHVSKHALLDLDIPLPPLDEQRHIAAVLDRADALRTKRRRAQAMLDDLLRSAFVEMFGDPVLNPKGWPEKELGSTIRFLTSGSRGWAKHYADEGALFIRIQNVQGGRLLLDDMQYVNAPDTKEAIRTRVEPGDLLISITADLGRTAVVDESTAIQGAHINQHLALVRLKAPLLPEFASAFLESVGGRRQFETLDQVGVKSGLNFKAIRSLRVPVPPLDLQHRYVEVQERVRELASKVSGGEGVTGDLYHALAQRAFRGELTEPGVAV
jgi:type I restriction enzyme S subunit